LEHLSTNIENCVGITLSSILMYHKMDMFKSRISPNCSIPLPFESLYRTSQSQIERFIRQIVKAQVTILMVRERIGAKCRFWLLWVFP